MASVFNNRRLSRLYSGLDVVLENSSTSSVDGFLRLKTGVGFGVHGRMVREHCVKLSATDLLSVTKSLKEHENEILEVIDIFEQAAAWAVNRFHLGERADKVNIALFNKVLMAESPLMVHGVHKGRNISLQIYGEGLNDLEISLDCRSPNKKRIFVSRMQEIIDNFRDHLLELENLNYTKIMEGVKA